MRPARSKRRRLFIRKTWQHRDYLSPLKYDLMKKKPSFVGSSFSSSMQPKTGWEEINSVLARCVVGGMVAYCLLFLRGRVSKSRARLGWKMVYGSAYCCLLFTLNSCLIRRPIGLARSNNSFCVRYGTLYATNAFRVLKLHHSFANENILKRERLMLCKRQEY